MKYMDVGMFCKQGLQLIDAAPLRILISTWHQGAPITAQIFYRDMLHPAWKERKKKDGRFFCGITAEA